MKRKEKLRRLHRKKQKSDKEREMDLLLFMDGNREASEKEVTVTVRKELEDFLKDWAKPDPSP